MIDVICVCNSLRIHCVIEKWEYVQFMFGLDTIDMNTSDCEQLNTHLPQNPNLNKHFSV